MKGIPGRNGWVMSTYLQAALSLSFLVSLLACPARAVDYGEPVPVGQFPAVGKVNIYGPQGVQSSGTGTLIAPDLVLTAAHVVQGAPTPVHIEFVLPGPEPFQARSLAYRCHSGFVNIFSSENSALLAELLEMNRDERQPVMDRVSASDIALVRLNRPFPGRGEFYSIADADPSLGSVATAVGFGIDEAKKSRGNQRLMGRLKLLHVQNSVLYFGAADGKFQMTDHGDSGGPLLLSRDNTYEICAIVHGGQTAGSVQGLTADAFGKFVSASRHKKWIETAGKELADVSPTGGEYFYLVRGKQTDLHPAVTWKQRLAFPQAGTPQARIRGRLINRGIADPLQLDDVKTLVNDLQIPEGQFLKITPTPATDSAKSEQPVKQ